MEFQSVTGVENGETFCQAASQPACVVCCSVGQWIGTKSFARIGWSLWGGSSGSMEFYDRKSKFRSYFICLDFLLLGVWLFSCSWGSLLETLCCAYLEDDDDDEDTQYMAINFFRQKRFRQLLKGNSRLHYISHIY